MSRSNGQAWATLAGRVRWLVEAKFAGSRSALGRAIGFSHTAIANVVAGKPPGPRLRDAIVSRLGVDPGWLQAGAGQPFPTDTFDAARGLPVTTVPLPGPPARHQALITGGWLVVPCVAPTPTAYWLSLAAGDPVVRQPRAGLLAGDHLLVEADPARFPAEARLQNTLCVIRGAGTTPPRLAWVMYYRADGVEAPERLEAEFPAPPRQEQVVEHVYTHLPGGEIRHHERRLGRATARTEPMHPLIRYADIVGVWQGVLFRPPG